MGVLGILEAGFRRFSKADQSLGLVRPRSCPGPWVS